mmetsp:Transcript_16443/g.30553  ORF Transcript_16443/g.30553 Transcript_16443/m.30553 type:complete len:235 (-) Transcript_16443:286-990(-)
MASTPYENADHALSINPSKTEENTGSAVLARHHHDGFLHIEDGDLPHAGIHRLHRDYLHGLDDAVVKSLPWNTAEERDHVHQLLKQRAMAQTVSSHGITVTAYSFLISIVILVAMVPRTLRNGDGQSPQEEYANMVWTIIVAIMVVDGILVFGVLVSYAYFTKLDRTIQTLVRKLMDEQDIGMPLHSPPPLVRDDVNQQGTFQLPEFVNLVWQRASNGGAPSQQGSQQCSTITF